MLNKKIYVHTYELKMIHIKCIWMVLNVGMAVGNGITGNNFINKTRKGALMHNPKMKMSHKWETQYSTPKILKSKEEIQPAVENMSLQLRELG